MECLICYCSNLTKYDNFSGPILVPIGFAEQSILALEQAVNIAKITDSELFLLTVVEEPSSIQKLFLITKNLNSN